MTEIELLSKISDGIEKLLKALEKNKSLPRAIFSVEEAAQYLNVSTTSLGRLRSSYAIDAVKNGDHRIGFTKEALDKFIKQRTIRSVDDERHLERIIPKGASHD